MPKDSLVNIAKTTKLDYKNVFWNVWESFHRKKSDNILMKDKKNIFKKEKNLVAYRKKCYKRLAATIRNHFWSENLAFLSKWVCFSYGLTKLVG